MSLFEGQTRWPGLLESIVKAPVRAARGVADGMGQVITGPADPTLTPEQNEQLKKRAMTQAGLAAMMASGPSPVSPNIAQIFAQSAMTGQQAYHQGAGQMKTQAARQQLGQAFGTGQLDRPRLQQLMVQLIASGDTEGAKAVSDLIKGLPGPQVLSAGAELRGPNGALIARNERSENPYQGLPAELVGLAQLMGVNASQLAQLPEETRNKLRDEWLKNREAGAHRTIFNPEVVTGKAVGEIAAEDYKAVVSTAREAQQRLTQLAALERLHQQGVSTGRWDQLTMPLREVAAGLGVPVEDLPAQQVYQAVSNQMTLSSAAMLNGPISEKELGFLSKINPNLANTPEGNRLILQIQRRLAERAIALQREANKYLARHKVLDAGWLEYKDQWIERQNAFEDLEQEAAQLQRRAIVGGVH